MKKVILKVEVHDHKSKQKAMKSISGLSGVESIAMDMNDKKLTVIGDVDPVTIVGKLRKFCHTDILSVGPAKEPEKKKEEPKKEEPKKEEPKKDGDEKKKLEEKQKQDMDNLLKAYQAYYHQQQQRFQPQPVPAYPSYYRSAEEDPNSCVIC